MNPGSDVVCVVLAGGHGTRFWPKSRSQHPKQFLSISSSGESLIQATVRRIESLIPDGRLWVVTGEAHKNLVREHVPSAQVLCEPIGRNTAASIGLAALEARALGTDPTMLVLPADHAVREESALCRTLERAMDVARRFDSLVTIGITPEYPHTGYGYIKKGPALAAERTAEVDRFVEKPDLVRAQEYVASGEYFWNSGMFVWRTSVIWAAFERFLPELVTGLLKIDDARGTARFQSVLEEVFPTLPAISIDYGVLEKASNRAVVQAEPLGWSDVGAWDAWAAHFPSDESGNVVVGPALAIESKNCVAYAGQRCVALLGVNDLVVIDTADALLVCPRDRVQDVRKIVDALKAGGKTELL